MSDQITDKAWLPALQHWARTLAESSHPVDNANGAYLAMGLAEIERLRFNRGKVANLLDRAATMLHHERTAAECRYVAEELREEPLAALNSEVAS